MKNKEEAHVEKDEKNHTHDDTESIVARHNKYLEEYFESIDPKEECSLVRGIEDLKWDRNDRGKDEAETTRVSARMGKGTHNPPPVTSPLEIDYGRLNKKDCSTMGQLQLRNHQNFFDHLLRPDGTFDYDWRILSRLDGAITKFVLYIPLDDVLDFEDINHWNDSSNCGELLQNFPYLRFLSLPLLDFENIAVTSSSIFKLVAFLLKLQELKLDLHNFKYNNLTSGIQPFLGNITSMDVFSALNTQLSGSIRDTLGHLKSLGVFRFGGCNLYGTIPPSVYNLSHLTHLFSLPNNELTGSLPPNIGAMLPHLVALKVMRGKKPTDDIFNEGISLHKFAYTALPDHVTNVVDG
ncbi:leucine-rich repeat protein [Artemisia annua]|uniref:Leucine-rich repeat protein n=1 Tax=Artemisia annua TaxID=35608 RepID=A0A2U1LU66_ARTAN|nr:leucine-rich repeat protein [Artemisia annua]